MFFFFYEMYDTSLGFLLTTRISSSISFQMRTFTLIFGFSMAFGALFSKTWRVYKIFSNKKLLHMVSIDLGKHKTERYNFIFFLALCTGG